MGALAELADRLERDVDPASPFHPKHPTLTIGKVTGGTAGNILARRCVLLFDLRNLPGEAARSQLAGFFELAGRVDAAIKARAPEGGVAIEQLADVPPLRPEADNPAEAFVRRLAGDNGPSRVVSFASEAGQFQGVGLPTVVCGPGSIDQAHQPDEYVDVAQMERGAAFMVRLAEALRS
jgi:acetylornithine deacetylase